MARLGVDEDLVRHLARLLEETGLTELEYDTGKLRVRVSRGGGAQMVVSAPLVAASPAAAPAAAEVTASHPGAVTAPMVGTVYVAPEPSAPSFVKIGDRVSEGQVLFIIEAMKTMNPIRAPRSGTVTQIFAVNAQPVEYGEVLLILE
ncbi:MAG TPA: acetyl-CoA carboxylase biotin carboxyl carrier protein subunit [Alphaproteobacteria bacterium]|jgi:acetyl-CoA carboxylase biotin carboxyl carrier protein|nr:acetyl-CoA carboxylase biotin carboxyl carrier protein subunit [Alphaproteobacteria bacterium]